MTVVDRLESGADQRALAVRLEVLHHRGGVERRAVVELDAVTERDRPLGEVGVGLHRLGEVRHHLVLGVGHHERVVDRGADLDARDGEPGARRAPAAGGLRLEPVGDRAAGLGRCCCWRRGARRRGHEHRRCARRARAPQHRRGCEHACRRQCASSCMDPDPPGLAHAQVTGRYPNSPWREPGTPRREPVPSLTVAWRSG